MCRFATQFICFAAVQDHMDIESLEQHNDRAIDALSDRLVLLKTVSCMPVGKLHQSCTTLQNSQWPDAAAWHDTPWSALGCTSPGRAAGTPLLLFMGGG
jgi:hypothetical protein